MNYVAMVVTETEKGEGEVLFRNRAEYEFDPPLEVNEDEAKVMGRIVEDAIIADMQSKRTNEG